MALDVIALALSKKYTEDSLEGAGALKGKDGADGKSAYEVAVEQGYSGTESEWLESLKGSNGAGILSIEKTSTNGLVDTYTITYTDDSTSTFDITNGKDGTGSAVIEEITTEEIDAMFE